MNLVLKKIKANKISNENSLDLSFSGLADLPSKIGRLASLQRLDLRNNQLTELPPEIGRLTSLQRLDLRNNQLTQLPSKIGRLASLQRLDLRNNQLTELPPEIRRLTALRQLHLDGTRLASVPSEIGQLTALQQLILMNNQLTELPSEIGQLTALQKLVLMNNQLAELPPEIGQLTALQQLDLMNNQLADLPPEIGQLTALQQLVLIGNQLGELPPEIGQLTALQQLDLRDNQLRDLPSEILQLKALQQLVFSGNRLTELPPEILQLTALQQLYLSGNKLTELLSDIGQLTALQEFYLSGNQLTVLPPGIGQLTALQRLDLRNNQLVELPSRIGQLTNLQKLYLSGNQLTELPSGIGQLITLQQLDLSGNQLTELPSKILQLTTLHQLDLGRNQLTELPSKIGLLTTLHQLGLGRNQLTELPSEIGQLNALQQLSLGGNQLTELPSEIGQLAALRQLDLSGNQLTKLPREIGQLTALQQLDLSGNQLTELPSEITQLTALQKLDLRGNERLGIPLEILGPSDLWKKPAPARAVLDFYFRSRSEATIPISEAKILVVGQGGVGKTSLVRRLVESTFDKEEAKTEGIDIIRWVAPPEHPVPEIRLNIWDFGGQEIMHATHQFFLTKRSLYLLVLDARKGEDESKLHYWLRIVQSFGGDSPVLVVTNKSEPPNFIDFNETRLTKDYFPNIKGFFNISCKEGSGLEVLEKAIFNQIRNLGHVHDQVPKSFMDTKQALEEKTLDHMPVADYRAICESRGVSKSSDQNLLLRFLHDLGSVLQFADPDSPYPLEETKVLNPQWVTEGVYRILNNLELMQQGGVLSPDLLRRILNSSNGYSNNGRLFIIGMMRKFELCFDFPDHSGRILVPELLSRNEPDLGLDHAESLRFQLKYEILPDGILPRFIVRTHENLTEKPTYWRSGVLLSVDENRVLVRGDTQNGRVFVSVFDAAPGRRGALTYVRQVLRAIHRTIPGLEVDEQVPLPRDPGKTVRYRYLRHQESVGNVEVWPEQATEKYSLRELLDGIADLEPLEEGREGRGKREIYNVSGNVYNVGGQGNVVGEGHQANKVEGSGNTVAQGDKTETPQETKKGWSWGTILGVLLGLAGLAATLAFGFGWIGG